MVRNCEMAGWPTDMILLLSMVIRRSGLPSSPVTSLMVRKSWPASSITWVMTNLAWLWACFHSPEAGL